MLSAKSALLLAASVLFAMPSYASQELAKKHNCMACHQMDKKIVGPSWTDISQKYKNDPKAADKLISKVKLGGAGVWGPVPMPPQSAPEGDIRKIIEWVLSSK